MNVALFSIADANDRKKKKKHKYTIFDQMDRQKKNSQQIFDTKDAIALHKKQLSMLIQID